MMFLLTQLGEYICSSTDKEKIYNAKKKLEQMFYDEPDFEVTEYADNVDELLDKISGDATGFYKVTVSTGAVMCERIMLRDTRIMNIDKVVKKESPMMIDGKRHVKYIIHLFAHDDKQARQLGVMKINDYKQSEKRRKETERMIIDAYNKRRN